MSIAAFINFPLACYDNFGQTVKEENALDHNQQTTTPEPIKDANTPIPGNDGKITISNITYTSLTLSWEKAKDNYSAQENLQYRVYWSSQNNINTFHDARTNGIQITPNWSIDCDSIDVLGLREGTCYYFNVYVRDQADNIQAYRSIAASTKGGVIFLFSAGEYTGKLGGRSGADSICSEKAASLGLPVTRAHAFISVANSDTIRNLPTNYEVPVSWPIQSTGGIIIAETYKDLFDVSINTTLQSAGITSNFWWSGSDASGDLIEATSAAITSTTNTLAGSTCGGWSSDDSKFSGSVGAHQLNSSQWLYWKARNCNTTQSLLCIGW